MSKASELIERMERETGQRIDDNGGDNFAMNGLFGAIAREMGQAPKSCSERDDVAVGTVLRHRMSPEYEREQRMKELFVELFIAGLD